MAEFIPEPVTAPTGRLGSVREDVHIHAPYYVVRERLLKIAQLDEWLGSHFQDYEIGRAHV